MSRVGRAVCRSHTPPVLQGFIVLASVDSSNSRAWSVAEPAAARISAHTAEESKSMFANARGGNKCAATDCMARCPFLQRCEGQTAWLAPRGLSWGDSTAAHAHNSLMLSGATGLSPGRAA